MKKCILLVGNDKKNFGDGKQKVTDYVELIHIVADMRKAIEALEKKQQYLLIVIFWLSSHYNFSLLKRIRSITNIPILALAEKYDGSEKIAVIKAGADDYILWPETLQEMAASCHALIRRYTMLNQRIAKSEIVQGSVFIDEDLRRAYIYMV